MQARHNNTVVMLAIGAVALLLFRSCSSTEVYESPVGSSESAPPAAARLSQEEWIDSVLSTMTLEEKVGQLFMVAATGHYSCCGRGRVRADAIAGQGPPHRRNHALAERRV